MEVTMIKCPNCDANIEVEEGKQISFCQYCGASINVDDGTKKHQYREIDEARIREAEVHERVRMRELEIEQQKLDQSDVKTAYNNLVDLHLSYVRWIKRFFIASLVLFAAIIFGVIVNSDAITGLAFFLYVAMVIVAGAIFLIKTKNYK